MLFTRRLTSLTGSLIQQKSAFSAAAAPTTRVLLSSMGQRFAFSTNATSPIQTIATAANTTATPPTDYLSTAQQIPDIDAITAIASRSMRMDDLSFFQQAYAGETDVSNISEAIMPVASTLPYDFIEKISTIAPMNLYNEFDVFSREALMYLTTDMGWGMGMSIIGISLGIKFAFMPLMMGTQINALKMQLLEPEQKNYQAQVSRLQKQGDFNGVREAQKHFFAMQKRHGIRNWIALVSMLQIPVLITWFISLRYVTSIPDKFPQLRTDGMLWFQDLAEQDPYCILPIISAFISFLNLSLSTTTGGLSQNAFFQKYKKYVKFTPLLSLPITIFFPAALNLYWGISAATHLIVPLLLRNLTTRSLLGIPKFLPGTILDRQNQDKAQKVIKAVISDNRTAATTSATAATVQISSSTATAAAAGGKITTSSSKVQEVFTNKPSATAATAATEHKTTMSTTAATQVFSNKPSKKK